MTEVRCVYCSAVIKYSSMRPLFGFSLGVNGAWLDSNTIPLESHICPHHYTRLHRPKVTSELAAELRASLRETLVLLEGLE